MSASSVRAVTMMIGSSFVRASARSSLGEGEPGLPGKHPVEQHQRRQRVLQLRVRRLGVGDAVDFVTGVDQVDRDELEYRRLVLDHQDARNQWCTPSPGAMPSPQPSPAAAARGSPLDALALALRELRACGAGSPARAHSSATSARICSDEACRTSLPRTTCTTASAMFFAWSPMRSTDLAMNTISSAELIVRGSSIM